MCEHGTRRNILLSKHALSHTLLSLFGRVLKSRERARVGTEYEKQRETKRNKRHYLQNAGERGQCCLSKPPAKDRRGWHPAQPNRRHDLHTFSVAKHPTPSSTQIFPVFFMETASWAETTARSSTCAAEEAGNKPCIYEVQQCQWHLCNLFMRVVMESQLSSTPISQVTKEECRGERRGVGRMIMKMWRKEAAEEGNGNSGQRMMGIRGWWRR